MPQCLTCSFCSMQDRDNCVCLLDTKPRTERKCLVVHECKKWKLAPKDSVHSRSSKKMTFDNNNKVILT